MSLNIVLPSYKESENLKNLIPKIINTCDEFLSDYKIIVIDTNIPMDDTKKVTEMYSNVLYIGRYPSNVYGDAIRTALHNIDKDYTIFMDADGSHPVEFIKTLYQNRFNANVVIGSRYVGIRNNNNSLILKLMSRTLNGIYSVLFGLKCKDISNSFKLYKTSDLTKLHLKSNNFNIIQEILIKLRKNNKQLKILEISCPFYKREHGNSKRNYFTFIISYIITIFRLKFDI
jgi:dolichol-phosphate mannosyltransferase